ncbi:PTS system mannose-specific EIIC component [Anaerostipes hadrus]|uniref:PTS system mannose-specific EIIC component n=2 Tax=Anaerostipes hadrus TaxID=649756 RepID=A0A173TUL4_ANAHA|nr:PTS system mannose-specific EIIC component [Anaerostipes hadrus]
MLDICHVAALVVQALRVAIPTFLVAAVVSPEGVQTLLNSIPKVVTGGLTVAGGMIVVVGYAMVLNMMGAKYLMPFFFLGFVIAAFTEFNLVAFGIMGAVFAIVYVQLNPKFQTPVAAPVAAGAGGSDDLDDDLDDELD